MGGQGMGGIFEWGFRELCYQLVSGQREAVVYVHGMGGEYPVER